MTHSRRLRIICSWQFTRNHSRNRAGAYDCGMAYAVGLRQLGHEVYVVEEVNAGRCRGQHHERVPFHSWDGRQYFEWLMTSYGFWPRASLIYEEGQETYGMSMAEVRRVVAGADLILGIAATLRSPAFEHASLRAYVDEAPGVTQVYHEEYGADQGLDEHDLFFTVGLNIGRPACVIPTAGKTWHGIVHPVSLDDWPARMDQHCRRFTTISNWADKQTFAFAGQYSGSKIDQWMRFIDTPSRTGQELELALNLPPGYEADLIPFHDHGWVIADAGRLRTIDDYRAYIGSSRGEFSVANSRYVAFATGWTSDRTARYLASGKPAVVQSTGAEAFLPTGKGLLTFSSPDEAVDALEEVNGNYPVHCQAARELAREYFDARRVMTGVLCHAGLVP